MQSAKWKSYNISPSLHFKITWHSRLILNMNVCVCARGCVYVCVIKHNSVRIYFSEWTICVSIFVFQLTLFVTYSTRRVTWCHTPLTTGSHPLFVEHKVVPLCCLFFSTIYIFLSSDVWSLDTKVYTLYFLFCLQYHTAWTFRLYIPI
jgi:hypothetical protein